MIRVERVVAYAFKAFTSAARYIGGACIRLDTPHNRVRDCYVYYANTGIRVGRYSIVEGNIVSLIQYDGYNWRPTGIALIDYYAVAKNNVLLNCGLPPDWTAGYNLYANSAYCLIEGNVTEGGTQGVSLEGSYPYLHSVKILNNVFDSPKLYGIGLGGKWHIVKGNVIINAGQQRLGNQLQAAIVESGGSDTGGSVIAQNQFIDNQTTHTMLYGYFEVNAPTLPNLLTANAFDGVNTPAKLASGSSTVLTGNRGYNPQAASTVTVQANATTTVGPFNHPVQVILSAPQNATGVSLTRSGTATSLPIQSSYFLYPGDTLSISEGATAQTAYIVPL